MTEYPKFQCDNCGDWHGSINWVEVYPVVVEAVDRYREPSERILHGCIDCYANSYGSIRNPENLQKWTASRDYTEGPGLNINGMLVGETEKEKEWGHVSRNTFSEEHESISQFIDSIII